MYDKFKNIISEIMDINSIKIYGVNASAFLASLTGIDEIVKLLIGVAVLVYTVVKTWDIVRAWVKKGK